MAAKDFEFNFKFKLTAREMLELVIQRNTAVDIHVYGDTPPEILPVKSVAPALPTPGKGGQGHGRKGNGKPTLQLQMLAFLVANPQGKTKQELKEFAIQCKYSPNSVENQIFFLMRSKLIRNKKIKGQRYNPTYIPTKKALDHG